VASDASTDAGESVAPSGIRAQRQSRAEEDPPVRRVFDALDPPAFVETVGELLPAQPVGRQDALRLAPVPVGREEDADSNRCAPLVHDALSDELTKLVLVRPVGGGPNPDGRRERVKRPAGRVGDRPAHCPGEDAGSLEGERRGEIRVLRRCVAILAG
jgi:hypothetical protein